MAPPTANNDDETLVPPDPEDPNAAASATATGGDEIIVHEGECTRIYRARVPTDEIAIANRTSQTVGSSTTATTTTSTTIELAIKCLPNPPNRSCPYDEDSARLRNEHRILSGPLNNCPGIPRAVKLDRYDGMEALFLEWAEGATLKDFLSSVADEDGRTARERLLLKTEIAWKIAEILSAVHARGILHNDLTSRSIILDASGHDGDGSTARDEAKEIDDGKGDGLAVTLVGFGYAGPANQCEQTDDGTRINDDLFALGSIYRLLFDGISEEEGGLGFGGGGGRSNLRAPPLDPSCPRDGATLPSAEAVPRAVRDVVRDLTDVSTAAGDDDADDDGPLPYAYAREVEEDLRQILDDPDAFLFDEGARGVPTSAADETVALMTRMSATKRLYGRSNEVRLLMEAFDEIDDAASMTIVTGPSGIGKSALIESLREPVESRNGYYIMGKFDQLRIGRPFSAIVSALTEFCDLVLSRKIVRTSTASEVKDAMGSQGRILADIIPGLLALTGDLPDADGSEDLSGTEIRNRFKFALRNFARAMSTVEHPVVMVVEDLQFADRGSVEVLEMLATDAENRSMLFVGSYRDDEIESDHPLLASLERIKAAGDDRLMRLALGDLDVEAVNLFLSDMLKTRRRRTRPLAAIVHGKTNGNALFASRFLRTLVSDGVISFSTESRRWRWDLEQIRRADPTDNVLDLMTGGMQKLAGEVRDVLKVAAAIGSYFDAETVSLVSMSLQRTNETDLSGSAEQHGGRCEVARILEDLVGNGLIHELAGKGRPSRLFRFAHDRVQQAAYSLLSEEERGRLHLTIGKIFWQRLEEDNCGDPEGSLFFAVDQLNRGSAMMDGDERRRLAKLNLRAGKRAITSSAFIPAETYLKAGIAMLDKTTCWETQYDLCIQLFGSLAETLYCIGNFVETKDTLDEIFEHTTSFSDQLDAYCTLIQCLTAQGKCREAVDTGLKVLGRLGEKFPARSSTGSIVLDLFKTKLLLARKSDNKLTNLPPMTDPTKMASMKILCLVMTDIYFVDPNFLPMIAFRMVRISILHGVSGETAVAFAIYGLILCGVLGDVKGGFRFGKLALTLSERYNIKKWDTQIRCILLYGIYPWQRGVGDCTEGLLNAYQIGMEAGNNEYAAYSINHYSLYSFLCGRPLDQLEKDIKGYCKVLSEYGQDMTLRILFPLWKITLRLLGQSDDTAKLAGYNDEYENDISDKEPDNKGQPIEIATKYSCGVALAYLFDELGLANELLGKSLDFVKVAPAGFAQICFQTFYDGMAAFALARSTNKRKWRKRAIRATKKMNKLARRSPGSCSHKAMLLVAERTALKGKSDATQKAYDEAIIACKKRSFVQDEALACERAGLFFSRAGKDTIARRYLFRSSQLYLDWGAIAKNDQLCEQYSLREEDDKSGPDSSALAGSHDGLSISH